MLGGSFVGFPKIGRVRTRATRVEAAPIWLYLKLEVINFHHMQFTRSGLSMGITRGYPLRMIMLGCEIPQ